MTKIKIDLYNVEHPARQKAIRILEEVIDRTGKNIKGEAWYQLEDFITEVIANKI